MYNLSVVHTACCNAEYFDSIELAILKVQSILSYPENVSYQILFLALEKGK